MRYVSLPVSVCAILIPPPVSVMGSVGGDEGDGKKEKEREEEEEDRCCSPTTRVSLFLFVSFYTHKRNKVPLPPTPPTLRWAVICH
jgi:hypothetical protein